MKMMTLMMMMIFFSEKTPDKWGRNKGSKIWEVGNEEYFWPEYLPMFLTNVFITFG